MPHILDDRLNQVSVAGAKERTIDCGKVSLAGSVSQRACVFCGSRVVLYPIDPWPNRLRSLYLGYQRFSVFGF